MQYPLNSSVYPSGYDIEINYTNIRDYFNSVIQDDQILAILGRPVKRTIQDKENNIILKTGDLITVNAVIQAQQAGHLEILLDSVYW